MLEKKAINIMRPESASLFESGDIVMYTSNSGDIDVATVVRIHFDDDPPYYTIRLERSNIEKQTDACNLTTLFEDNSEEKNTDRKPVREENLSKGDDLVGKRNVYARARPLLTAFYATVLSMWPIPSEYMFILGLSHYVVSGIRKKWINDKNL